MVRNHELYFYLIPAHVHILIISYGLRTAGHRVCQKRAYMEAKLMYTNLKMQKKKRHLINI